MQKRSVAENSMKRSLDAVLQEVLDILEADDGKSFEEKKEAAVNRLRTCQDEFVAETLADFAVADIVGLQLQNEFWKSGAVFYGDEHVALRRVQDVDRDAFIEIQREYSVMKEMLREEAYCNLVWNEHTESKTLMFSILKDGKYVGYCGIKNISHKHWEIVIEIQKEWTRQGIGPIAISAMLNEIKSRSGVTQYRVRIDPANQASQKMFEKLGAVPNGLSELWIHDEEALAQCEKDNLHQIDGQITELAKKFGVAPQKLLSHVLEYTLSWT